ncbi:lipopolysaccharide biosynthesis protein [Halotalea alkalilenta]|uniref:lipopolysaccharide biosynthesis protein n=1 Tax=Halotalea alkalilenta TaxID=376489 RepID=UPI0009DD0A72|nr:oligosaccharide flippase family protein [Halotalea alkalilenta]
MGKINNGNSQKVFFKNALTLMGGAALGKVIALMSIPIITRIYDPETYGLYAIFVSATAMMGTISSLRYCYAIPLPNSKKLAMYIFVISIVIALLQSILFGGILYWQGEIIFNLLNAPLLYNYWYLLVLSFLSVALFECLSMWAIREKSFRLLAMANVTQNFSGSLSKILIGMTSWYNIGLLIGQIINQIGGVQLLIKGVISCFKIAKPFSLKKYKLLIFAYIDFPIYRMPAQVMLVLSMQAPLLLSSYFYGLNTAGQLSLAMTVVSLPVMLVAQSLGQVYYAEVSKIGKHNPLKIYRLSKNLILKSLMLVSAPCACLVMFGPILFSVVFGSQWEHAGEIARILALTLVGQFIANPIMNVLSVFDQQKLFFKINTVRALGVIVIFLLPHLIAIELYVVICLYSLFLTSHYFVTTYKIIKFVKLRAISQ